MDPTAVWASAITAIAVTVGFIAQIVLQVMAKVEAKRVADEAKASQLIIAKAAEEAASAAQQVKATLAEATARTDSKLANIVSTGDKVHTLVNSAMGIQLKLNAVMARRVASMTREEADVVAATAAETMYTEHMEKQDKLDARDAR